MKVIVLGGGISGLSLAWKLTNYGVKVCVLESSQKVGGLARTYREDGYCLDVGPHSLFSDDTEVLNTVLRLFNNELEPTVRSVKFYHKGKYLDYPLTAHSVLFQMGIWSGIRVALSFLKGKIFNRKSISVDGEDENVEDWAIRSFGEHLYKTFFKPYTEQFWKVPCTELSANTIPTHTRMSFFNTLRLLIQRRLVKPGSSLIEREMLPTYYPKAGFGEIVERISDIIKEAGARIHTGCQVVGVDESTNAKIRVWYKSNGEQKDMEGTHVISTIPINQFVKILNPPAPSEVLSSADNLEYRSLVALGMVTEKQTILKCSYLYVLNRPYNRISEMNEFSPDTSPVKDNIIMVEIPCLRDSAAWGASKESLFDMCIDSLAKDGILAPGDVKRLLLVKEPNAYPIYSKNYAIHLKRVVEYINERNEISILGRTGEFFYMDIDKCVRRAFNLADKLMESNAA